MSYSKNYVFRISMIAAMGGLLFGFDIAVISGVIEFIQKPEIFNLSAFEKGFTVGSNVFGCIIGCLLSGKFGDYYGRKPSLMGAAILFGICSIGSALSNSITSFIIFRIIGGIGVGAASTLSPMYISEIAPAKLRGTLVSLNQLTIVIGILLAYFSNYIISALGTNDWRLMTGIMIIPSIFFFFGLFTVPESPRWLTIKNRKNESFQLLQKINSLSEAQLIQEDINKSVQQHQYEKGQLKDLLQPGIRRTFFIAIMLAILQQITGINIIIFYAPSIFAHMGLGTNAALWQTVITGSINVLFTFFAIFFVDKIGRKKILSFGVLGMALFQFLLAALFLKGDLKNPFIIIGLLGNIACFAASLGPVMWVVIAEIFPNKSRSIGIAVSIIFLWIANFVLSVTFPIMLKYLDAGFSFLIYACICIITFFFILIFVNETKNKSLEELETIYINH